MKESDLKVKKRVFEIFEEVFDAPLATREVLLAKRCGENTTLRAGVEKLLLAAASDDDFLESPALEKAILDHQSHLHESFIGREIGKFVLTSFLGRGGMGTVYLGESVDDEFNQKVAVKIVSPLLSEKPDNEYFKRERKILAKLEHPSIARFLDGGKSENGTPYLVMEYVEGVSLTEYCRHEHLSLSQRLKLFLEICEAVKFAHQNLIIHRDIKPSNILVNSKGKPKLLDFGVAKMLNPDAFDVTANLTVTAKILTPNYASPEQLKGESITTASDVYSLGVIFYELLTGKRPHNLTNRSLPEILRTITEEIPIVPSQQTSPDETAASRLEEENTDEFSLIGTDPKLLKGDLDTIVLKSLEKDAKDRYQTVEQFIDDLSRYQNNLPILATPPSKSYRLKKFIDRNRLPFALACSTVILAIGLLAFSFWSARTSAIQARENLRRAYASDMNLAMQSYETANLIRLRQILERYKDVDFRGWEYGFLNSLAYPKSKIATLPHEAEVWHVDFSPDGKRLATACADGFARIYEVPSGKLLVTTATKEKNVWKIDFSPDGKLLATASGDSKSTSVKIWDSSSGKEIRSLKGHTDRVRAIAYSPDGKTIATGSRDGTIRLWNARHGSELDVIEVPLFRGRTVETHDLEFSPDGEKLLFGSGPSVGIYDLSKSKRIVVNNGIESILAVAFSPSSKRIALGSHGSEIEIYDSDTLKLEFKIATPKANVNDIDFSPDGETIASASSDRTVRFFNSRTGAEKKNLRVHSADAWSVSFSQDGEHVATGSTDFEAFLFVGKKLLESSAFGAQVGFSPRWSAISVDRRLLATSDGSPEKFSHSIYDLRNRKLRKRFSDELINAGAFSPDGTSLATLMLDGSIVIWDSSTGNEVRRFKAHNKPPGLLESGRSIAYSPDGKHIVSGAFDNYVKVWDARTGRLVRTLQEFDNYVSKVGVSNDGLILFAASYDLSAKLFDFNSGKVIVDLERQQKPILSLAFAPDGKKVATGGADGAIKVWNLADGRLLKTLTGNAGFIWQLTYSPDGTRLVSASGEGVIRFWDTDTDLQVLAIRTNSAVTNLLAFTPDGKTLISLGTNERIRLWETE